MPAEPNHETATTLFLVRHGQSEANLQRRFAGQLDSPLSELGREQAREAAQRLADESIAIAYASPLRRARSTAEVICAELGLDLHVADGLKEMCFGPWQGRPIDEAERRWPDDFAHYRRAPSQFSLAGAETFPELQRRVVETVHTIARRHPGQRVLIVSHGVATKVLLLHLREQPLDALPTLTTMKNGAHVEVTVTPPSGAQ